MKRIFKTVWLSLILTLISSAILANEKWYRVEVLVFETQNNDGSAAAISNVPNFANALDFSQIPNEKFKSLTDKEFSLIDAKSKIQKRYRLIAHKGWKQTLEPKNEAQAVHIMGGKENLNSPELNGIVRLSGGKFLHVDTDMLFNKDSHIFRMKDSSRIKANEIHYVDHPLYGMIISVTPEKS